MESNPTIGREAVGDAPKTRSRLDILAKHVRQLQEDIGQLSLALAEISAEQRARTRAVAEADVQQILETRRLRDECFGAALFADPAWDLLLHLYAAKLGNRTVSVSALCHDVAAPFGTALRSLSRLNRAGWVVREKDGSDRRLVIVQLSERASAKMQTVFDAVGGAVIGV